MKNRAEWLIVTMGALCIAGLERTVFMVLRNLSLFLAVLATAGTALADSVPYPAELERAAIEVGLLSSILEHALIIG